MASLGSLLGRLTGKRSIPICGRDMVKSWSLDPATAATVPSGIRVQSTTISYVDLAEAVARVEGRVGGGDAGF